MIVKRGPYGRELKHTYPKGYEPGKTWFLTEAWDILDVLTPGALSDEARALVAGMIGGRLVKERLRAVKIAERGRAPHVAEAIRHEP